MHKAVVAFLETFDSVSRADPSNLIYIPLLTGRSAAALFRFNVNKHAYVLKILPPQASVLNRKHEIQLAKNAGEMGIGPKLHFIDLHSEAFIMDFFPGRTVHPLDFQGSDQLIQFAQLIRKLHQSSLKYPVACSPFQRFHTFLTKSEKLGLILSPRLSKIKNVMKEVEVAFQCREIPHVPCHLDLHSLNILSENENFIIVDWVNGGLSNPYFDLATFSIFHDLNELQMRTFLTSYFGRSPTKLEWNLFVLAQPVRLLVIAMGCLSASSEKIASYRDALVHSATMKFKDYIQLDPSENIKISLWKVGLIMMKKGLELIDENKFHASLRFLQSVSLTSPGLRVRRISRRCYRH